MIWRRYFIPFALLCCMAAGGATARADQLHLKDGRVVEAEEVWEAGDALWFRQGKMVASVSKADVVRRVELNPVRVPPPGASPASHALGNEGAAGSPGPSAVARIVLKGETQIEVDAVWEQGDCLGYRLGNMQTFIDREAVERVVREVGTGEKPAPSRPGLRFTTGHAGLDQLIAGSAARYGLDARLIYLVMREESGFNRRAVSRVGARGLMQLMPETARRLGVRNIHDPAENVEAGTRYLKSLITLFGGDVNLALAAYNAGEGAVTRYGNRIPPYRETQGYVRRINLAYRRMVGD